MLCLPQTLGLQGVLRQFIQTYTVVRHVHYTMSMLNELFEIVSSKCS